VRLQIENRSVNVKLTSNTATINASTTVAAALTSHQRSLEQEHYYQVIFFDEARLAARDAFLLSQHSRSPSITREKTQFAREIHPREKPTVTHEKHNHTWKTARFRAHVENRKRTRENNAHPTTSAWSLMIAASRAEAPSEFFISIEAPTSRSKWTTETWPRRAASISGVVPSLWARSTAAPP